MTNTTTTKVIELKEYTLLENLNNDIDVIQELMNDYDGSVYVCDAVTEVADRSVSIYNHELWENAPKIQEYIEQGIEVGLVNTKQLNLMNVFQIGELLYYESLLNNNLDEIAFNKVANVVNDYLVTLEVEKIEKIDFDFLIFLIENFTDNFDHNDTFSSLDEKASEVIESIKQKLEDNQ